MYIITWVFDLTGFRQNKLKMAMCGFATKKAFFERKRTLAMLARFQKCSTFAHWGFLKKD